MVKSHMRKILHEEYTGGESVEKMYTNERVGISTEIAHLQPP